MPFICIWDVAKLTGGICVDKQVITPASYLPPLYLYHLRFLWPQQLGGALSELFGSDVNWNCPWSASYLYRLHHTPCRNVNIASFLLGSYIHCIYYIYISIRVNTTVTGVSLAAWLIIFGRLNKVFFFVISNPLQLLLCFWDLYRVEKNIMLIYRYEFFLSSFRRGSLRFGYHQSPLLLQKCLIFLIPIREILWFRDFYCSDFIFKYDNYKRRWPKQY